MCVGFESFDMSIFFKTVLRNDNSFFFWSLRFFFSVGCFDSPDFFSLSVLFLLAEKVVFIIYVYISSHFSKFLLLYIAEFKWFADSMMKVERNISRGRTNPHERCKSSRSVITYSKVSSVKVDILGWALINGCFLIRFVIVILRLFNLFSLSIRPLFAI